MTPGEFRANMAGYLDSAEKLTSLVKDALIAGAAEKDKHQRSKIAVPPAMIQQLDEAIRANSLVSEWLVSQHNSPMEK